MKLLIQRAGPEAAVGSALSAEPILTLARAILTPAYPPPQVHASCFSRPCCALACSRVCLPPDVVGTGSPSSWGGPESLTMSGRLLDQGGAAGLGREQQSSQGLPYCGYSPGTAQPPLPQAFPSLPGPCRLLQPLCPLRLRAAATTLSQLVNSAGWLPPGLRSEEVLLQLPDSPTR